MKYLKFKILVFFLVSFIAISLAYAVDITRPSVSLTSSAGYILSLGQTTTLSCTATDDTAMLSVTMDIDGVAFCSGIDSCSSDYIMATSTWKSVGCTAMDTSGNYAGGSRALTTGGGGGGGAGGGYINANIQLSKTILNLNEQIEINCVGDSSQPIINYLIKITNPSGEQFTGGISGESTASFIGTSILGIYSVDCRVTNNLGISIDAETKTFEVKLNSPPIINSYSPEIPITIDEGTSQLFTQTSSDSDGDTLTYSWLLDGIEVSTAQDYTYSSDYNSAGTHNLTLVISDGLLQTSKEWTITVNNVDNISPTLTLISSSGTTINLGQTTTLDCLSIDDIAMLSVSIIVDGNDICSGISSCSGDYTIATATDKIVTCTVIDASNNTATISLTLSIPAPASSGGSSGGGGGDGGSSSNDNYECVEGKHYTCSEWNECTGHGTLGVRSRTCEKTEFCKPYNPKLLEQCTLPVIGVLPPNNPLLPEETTSETASENTEEPTGLTSITGRAVSGINESFKAIENVIKETFVNIFNFFKNWFK